MEVIFLDLTDDEIRKKAEEAARLCSYEGEEGSAYADYDPFPREEEGEEEFLESYPGPYLSPKGAFGKAWERGEEDRRQEKKRGEEDKRQEKKRGEEERLSSRSIPSPGPSSQPKLSTNPSASLEAIVITTIPGPGSDPSLKSPESAVKPDEPGASPFDPEDDDYFDFPDTPKPRSMPRPARLMPYSTAKPPERVPLAPGIRQEPDSAADSQSGPGGTPAPGRGSPGSSRVRALKKISVEGLLGDGETELSLDRAPSYRLFVDGSSLKNPGHAGGGAVLYAPDGSIVFACGVYLGMATNNEAEYMGLIMGLKMALKDGVRSVDVFSDSKLVVNQVMGSYGINAPHLKKYLLAARKNLDLFQSSTLTHVRREGNMIADTMASRASQGGKEGSLKEGDLIQADEEEICSF
jgi:ribonuclease HI